MTVDDLLLALDKSSIKFECDRARWFVILQKLSAAEHQISKAISLYLDEKDYLCAITLSGAALSMLSEMLRQEFNCDPLHAAAMFIEWTTARNDSLENANARDIKNAEKNAINWLKHYKLTSENQPELKSFCDEDAVTHAIDSALSAYSKFIEEFSITLSPKIREDLFGSPQISQWQEHWCNDNYFGQ